MTTGVVVILFNPDVEHVNALINAFTAPEWNIVLVDNSFERTQYSASRNVTYIHC